jgi:hypothetical protein
MRLINGTNAHPEHIVYITMYTHKRLNFGRAYDGYYYYYNRLQFYLKFNELIINPYIEKKKQRNLNENKILHA